MLEDALDALEHAIALSEARQEVPADNVTKRVTELYRRIQRTHSRCQRLSLSVSEIRSTGDSEEMQSISLTDDLTSSMLRASELEEEYAPKATGVFQSTSSSVRGEPELKEDPPLPLQAARPSHATAISTTRAPHLTGATLSRPTAAPIDSHSDDDSDGDLVAPTYAGVLAPNRLGPMASERSALCAPVHTAWPPCTRHGPSLPKPLLNQCVAPVQV